MLKQKMIAMAVTINVILTLVACSGGGSADIIITTNGGTTSSNDITTSSSNETTNSNDGTTASSSATNEDASEVVSEHLVLSIALWDIALGFPEDSSIDPMKQYFYDKFDVTIEPMGITWGDASERYQVWSSSDTMPDVCGGLAIEGSGMYFGWIRDGVVRALPDDVSAYPLVEQYVKLPEYIASTIDNKGYFLPRITYENTDWWAMDRGVYFRRDWMDNLGLEYPNSSEDFINMAIAFTFDDPDGNGIDDTFGVTRSEIGVWSQNIANFGYHEWIWRKVDDIWTQPNTTHYLIPLVDMFRRIQKAGALDPDFTVYKSAEPGDNIFAQSRAGFHLKQNTPGSVDSLRNLWMGYQPDLEFLDCVEYFKFWKEPGYDTYRLTAQPWWSETFIGSQVDDIKMDRILQIYNWLYSLEGRMFMLYGFEGEDYQYASDGEVEILLPILDTGALQPLNQKYPFARLVSLACWTGSMMQYDNVRTPKEIREFAIVERDYRIANWKDPQVSWMVNSIDVPEKQETTYDTNELWTIIMMDPSDTSTEDLYWNFMVPELEAGGYFRMRDAVNAKAVEMGL